MTKKKSLPSFSKTNANWMFETNTSKMSMKSKNSNSTHMIGKIPKTLRIAKLRLKSIDKEIDNL